MHTAVKYLTVLALAAATPALAQTGTGTTNNGNTSAAGQSAADMNNTPQARQAIQHDLQQAGFTDVQVMPSSFLVRAKDKQGRPVMMVINPDSITAVTQMGANNSSGSSSNSTQK